MKKKIKEKIRGINKIQYLLLTLYIVFLFLFGGGDLYRIPYLPLLIFALIEIMHIYKNKKIKINKQIIILLLFNAFAFLSCIWASDKNRAFTMSITLLLTTITTVIIYNYCIRSKISLDKLLGMILAAGLALSIYIVITYGIESVYIMLTNGEARMGVDIDNVNIIGLELTIASIISFYFGATKNKRYYILAIVIALLALGTASRKTIIGLALGIIIIILFKNSKNNIKAAANKLLALLLIISAMVVVIQSNALPMLTKRVEYFTNSLTNNGKTDTSIRERNLFIEYGFSSFTQKPILGIGIGNSGQITMQAAGRDTYLHNNYIELLATVGIIGALIYYTVPISLLLESIKKNKTTELSIIVAILTLVLVLDWGAVSYSEKMTYIYFLLGMVYINNTKITANIEETQNANSKKVS